MVWPRAVVSGLILTLAFAALAIASPVSDGHTLILSRGFIRTQTDAGDFVGSLAIRDGKIVAVWPTVPTPQGATIIDVSGCTITPGLIDARGGLGLNPQAAAETGRDASLNVVDGVDPYAEDWRDAARQGITAVYVQPNGRGSLGGSGAVMRACGGECTQALVIRSPAGVQATLGLAPQAQAQTSNPLAEALRQRGINIPTQQTPAAAPPAATTLTRFAQYEQLRGQFDAAKRYGESKPDRPDPAKELLLSAVRGAIPVCMEVHYEDDVRNALLLATAFGFQVHFSHLERIQPLPEALRASRCGIIVAPALGSQPSAEVRKLALDGRPFAIGTFGDARATAGLRLRAASAVAGGYPRADVLRALTSHPADMFGVGDKLGRLAPGRVADLAVFAGDPLDPSTRVRLTMSQGVVTHYDPKAEAVSRPPDSDVRNFPEKLPSSFIVRTTRLMNSSGTFAPGELHVVDGVLSAPNGQSPPTVIDVGDAPVTPGLVAVHLPVASGAEPDADASNLRVADLMGPEDSRVLAARNAGFLTTIAAPGADNVLAGMTFAIGSNDAPAPAETGFKFVLSAASRSRDRHPSSLAGQIDLIDARLRGLPGETSLYLPQALRSSLLAERERTLYAVRNRHVVAAFEAQARAEVRAALRLIQDHRLRGVLVVSRVEPELVDEIRQAGVAVVAAPLGPQSEQSHLEALVQLQSAGVPLALGGTGSEARASAAWLANHGLPRPAARRALLAEPGEVFGLPPGTGRLQAGDPASFVVWTGDPLDFASRPLTIVGRGKRLAIADQPRPTDTQATSTPANAPRTRGRGR